MHLFIWEFEQKDQKVFINNKRIVHQLKNVLRASLWYTFGIQPPVYVWDSPDNEIYILQLDSIDKNQLEASILETHKKSKQINNNWFLIPILNNFDKMELLVQKLTEIWTENIYFWDAARSQIHNINNKKLDRFYKISLEAAEQSWQILLPNIWIVQDIKKFTKDKEIVFIDFQASKKSLSTKSKNLWWVVWPEWGFSQDESSYFGSISKEKLSLWESVLRVETATIIWAWIIQNF